jgi:SAM-dependent methyltransferase
MMRRLVWRFSAWLRDPTQFTAPRLARECPICLYRGEFFSVGKPPRYDARCPRCRSRERHRLLHIFLERRRIDLEDGRAVLHFAPEAHLARKLGPLETYHSADIAPGKAKFTLDIQKIARSDSSYDVVIANHVLEHVPDDRAALAEFFRVLRPGGFAILTVPLNWARADTYETAAASTPAERFAHYADPLHLRYYGRDFPQRVAGAGFEVEEFRLSQDEEVRFALARGDVLYIGWKRRP